MTGLFQQFLTHQFTSNQMRYGPQENIHTGWTGALYLLLLSELTLARVFLRQYELSGFLPIGFFWSLVCLSLITHALLALERAFSVLLSFDKGTRCFFGNSSECGTLAWTWSMQGWDYTEVHLFSCQQFSNCWKSPQILEAWSVYLYYCSCCV